MRPSASKAPPPRFMFSPRSQLAFPVWLLIVSLSSITAQTPVTPGEGTERAELVRRLKVADSLGLQSEAFVIRARLRDGDFEVGDRIDVRYEGVITRSDSLAVESGRILRLGEPMGDLQLSGVLRSELADSVKARVDKYYRAEKVHVTSRLRLTVLGGVRSPGPLYARVDTPLSEVIMRAGGQDPSTDLTNVVIKRGGQIVMERSDVQSALTDGLTVERLGLHAGDEIVVGTRTPGNRWMLWLQIALPILAISIPLATRHR
jgi:protein involved in polysaccharide export with SLBB domain